MDHHIVSTPYGYKCSKCDVVCSIVESFKKPETKPTIKTRPDVGEEYWYIDLDSRDVVDKTWTDTYFDNFVWDIGLGCFTEKEVQRKLDVMMAKQRIADYRKEHGMEWEFKYGVYNFYIAFEYEDHELEISSSDYYKVAGMEFYFETDDHARQCFEDCKQDWLTILGVDR